MNEWENIWNPSKELIFQEKGKILQFKRDRIECLFISWTIYGIFAAYNEFHVHECMGWDNNKPLSYPHAIALMQYQHTVTLSQSSMSNRQRRERTKFHMLGGRKNAFTVIFEEVKSHLTDTG